jgi:two-component system cell cycle sensor histidine kinase/response regulator CckA
MTIEAEVAAALVAVMPDGVLLVDGDDRVSWANPCAAALLDTPLDALIGTSMVDLSWEPEQARERVLTDRLGHDNRPTPRPYRTAAGERRVLLVSPRVVCGQLALILRDPGDLDDTVERLRRTGASFRAVIENSPDCVIIHSQGRIVYANRTMLTTWRGALDDLIGRSALELVHADDRPMVIERQRAIADGAQSLPFIDERLLRKDGTEYLAQVGAVGILFDGKPAVMVVARDVTEARQRQARMGQVDRMVALGTLAAGVAHEIGNPLTYLLLRLDAAGVRAGELRAVVPAGTASAPILDELVGHLAAVSEGARRVRAIVSELRLFARTDDEPAVVDVTVPIERALSMAAHELSGIAVERAYQPAAPVIASEGKLTQVVLNLILNASYAIRASSHHGPHSVKVRVWSEGKQTRFAVTDTGIGIAAADLPRLFDPFFSTKPVGDGVGLGLAIAQSIVATGSGAIAVESTPGAGATFTVTFPSA